MERILVCIERGLSHYGVGISEFVYFRLKQTKNMERRDVVKKPEDFAACLEEIFGPGANRVESVLMTEIASSFKLQGSRDLVSAIKQARLLLYADMESQSGVQTKWS